jgi:hypothetical protein
MDSIILEQILYRIIQGRLRIRLGDLVLYIHEPCRELLEESVDIYTDAYNKAYFDNIPLKSELLPILVENNLWTPFDDKEADKIENQIEELKIQAFKNFFSSKTLNSIKRNIQFNEKRMLKYRSKKSCLDYTSCEGVANFARSVWLISKTTYDGSGNLYDWNKYGISYIMDKYNESTITVEQFRKIARSEPWRSMWAASKKHGNLFNKPSIEYTKEQLYLCSYSCMYDNIYESSECPNEQVIDDDDCLDGWMIIRRREHDKHRKEQEVNSMLKNPKIANSQEVFLVARDQEAAQEIYGLNNPIARNVVKSRAEKIVNANGQIKFTEFDDIKQDIAIQRNQQAINSIKGKGSR